MAICLTYADSETTGQIVGFNSFLGGNQLASKKTLQNPCAPEYNLPGINTPRTATAAAELAS